MSLENDFQKAMHALDRLRKKARAALQIKKAERSARAQLLGAMVRAEKAGRDVVTVSKRAARALVRRPAPTKSKSKKR